MAFGEDEYRGRLAKVRAAMAEAGIDVLVECDPANMNYLTGYDGWSYYIPQCAVVFQDRDLPLWIGRGMDLSGARLTCFMPEDHVMAYPEDLFGWADRHPMQFVAAEIAARGGGKRRVGAARDCQQMTPRMRDALAAALPDSRLIDGDLVVNRVRLVKSPAEIVKMREAARIAERVAEAFREGVRPGIRECDVAGELQRVATAGTAEYGGDYPASVPFLLAGPQAHTTHLTWTERRFGANETVCLQFGAVRQRYHCVLARTIHLGKPPAALAELDTIVMEGSEAALQAARPDARCEDVEAAWRKVISRHGLSKEQRIGYPIGIGYPPDWGEGTASFRPGDKTILAPNMTFHLFLGMWSAERSHVASETIRITESGAELLANVPRAMFVKT